MVAQLPSSIIAPPAAAARIQDRMASPLYWPSFTITGLFAKPHGLRARPPAVLDQPPPDRAAEPPLVRRTATVRRSPRRRGWRRRPRGAAGEGRRPPRQGPDRHLPHLVACALADTASRRRRDPRRRSRVRSIRQGPARLLRGRPARGRVRHSAARGDPPDGAV